MLAPLQFCAATGCPVRVPRGHCPRHAATVTAARRGYFTPRWAALRLEVFVDQAYACACCGRVALALELDHIRKHEGHPGLFWDRRNLQALCVPCHRRKTQRGE